MIPFTMIWDGILVVLLMIVLVFLIKLDRTLRAIRKKEGTISDLFASLSDATAQAERAIASLRDSSQQEAARLTELLRQVKVTSAGRGGSGARGRSAGSGAGGDSSQPSPAGRSDRAPSAPAQGLAEPLNLDRPAKADPQDNDQDLLSALANLR